MKNFITHEKISNWSESSKGLFVAVLISLSIKILLLISESTVNADGLLYISAAQEFAAGHFGKWLTTFPMPFYPMLIGITHFFIPDWLIAARALSIIFMVIAVVPLYWLTEELFSRKAAFWACLAFAISPVPNGLADSVVRDPGFIFCMAWAVYFAFQSIQSGRIVLFAVTALFSWISFLFRLEGIIFIIFFPIYLFVLYLSEYRKNFAMLKGVFLWSAIILFIFIIVIAVPGGEAIISIKANTHNYEKVRNFFQLKFVDNYRTIYEQLINLEKYSPYPGGGYNFAEIARHYIPLIYLFGLIESFIVVLSPIFLAPLLFSVKDAIQKKYIFILSVFFVFILMTYYFLINEDFIQKRYLFFSVFLLYPLIGVGIHRFFKYLSDKLSGKAFAALFLLFFVIPIYQCVKQELNQDNSLMIAASWIADNPKYNKLRIITTDQRFLFYAGRNYRVGDASPRIESDAFYSLNYKNSSYSELEQVAVQNQFGLIMFKTSSKTSVYQFKHFRLIKEFKGNKNTSYIFSSPEASGIIIK